MNKANKHKSIKKLRVNQQTIRILTVDQLTLAMGGGSDDNSIVGDNGVNCRQSK